jgi:superfamily I DNA/RNA helicase
LDARVDISAPKEALEQEFMHHGRPPAVYGAEGAVGQAHWLADKIIMAARDLRLPVDAAAILVPSNRLGKVLAQLLVKRGLPALFMASKDMKPSECCVKLMTLHAAKGLEFPIVAVAHVEADRLPRVLSDKHWICEG